jgi:hypothetical protein
MAVSLELNILIVSNLKNKWRGIKTKQKMIKSKNKKRIRFYISLFKLLNPFEKQWLFARYSLKNP